MFRSLPLLLLLAGSMAELPFYCRLRKPNCALRPNTRCCPASTTPEPSVSQPATTFYLAPTEKPAEEREAETGDDVEKAVRDEAVDEIEPKAIEEETKHYEELLEAEPSQIREVIVDPPKELNQISAPPPGPVKTAPRFCLVLKYNCKSRSSHPCCRHPLPPRGQPVGIAATPSPPAKTKSRPSRKPLPQRPSAPRKTVHSRPSLQRTPRPRPTPSQESVTSAPSSLRTRRPTRRSLLRRSRPTRATRPTTARPRPSLRPRRERPVFLAGKAPVCRIINCARTPAHKCCKKEEITTTEDTAIDSQATSTTPNTVIESEQEEEEEEMVVSHSASVSSVETKVVAVTNPRRRTRPTGETTTTTTTEEGVTDMAYRELELATPSQESQVLDLVYETTVEPEQQEVIYIENTQMVFKEIKGDTTLAPEEEEEGQGMTEKVDMDHPHESLQPPATAILYTPQSEVPPGPVSTLGQATKLGHEGGEIFTAVHSEISTPVHSEVYNPVHSEVYNPVHSEVYTPVHSKRENPVNIEMYSPLHSEVYTPVHSEIYTPVHSEVHTPVFSEVHIPVHSEVDSPVNSEVYTPVNSKIYTPVFSEVHTPVFSEVHTPVFSELHTPVNSEVATPVNSVAHPPVLQEINEEQQIHNEDVPPTQAVQETWQQAPSPVFVPHPVFVPEPGEKERIREEVEHRIEQEERRQEQEERRRQEHERRQQQEMVRQQEQRRKQEVEYWRSKVQEEERRREKEEQERKGWGSEELLEPAASYREARLVTLKEVLGEQEEQEGSHESVELPPRVRMECFRFDCLSSPWDPCCSRSKRQIQAQEDNRIHRDPLPGFRSPRLLPGWRVEATVTRVEKSIHWGED